MIQRSTASLADRLRRAGTARATTPDLESIIARARQRKRRRQIGVTAASVVVVGGFGFGSAQLLTGSADTSISAAGEAPIALSQTAAMTTPIVSTTTLKIEPAPSHQNQWPATPITSGTVATTSTSIDGVTQSLQATRRSELADGLGGAIMVSETQLLHRTSDGSVVPLELPEAATTTERRVTDVAMLDHRPFLLISDFTDRPDLAAEAASGNDADLNQDLIHQDLAIYAVDLTNDQVHIIEQRTITDRNSPDWVYNGHITTRNGHIMVVRELWQSMCVYVESFTLDGTKVETPENPLPEPSLAGLTADSIRDMQAGLIEPPRGCIAATELPDGSMSVLGLQAEPTALDSVNLQLRSAASMAANAFTD